jgi:hypothetical protein
MLAELSITSQMDVNDRIAIKAIEEVLSGRLDRVQRLARDFARVAAKTSLRAGHPQRLADKQITMLASDKVGLVTFRHDFQ